MAERGEASGKVWTCKIGETDPMNVPQGADEPMRQSVERTYRRLTGEDPEFIFSGWGGELTEPERAVVEDRMPSEEHYRQWLDERSVSEALEAATDQAVREDQTRRIVEALREYDGKWDEGELVGYITREFGAPPPEDEVSP